jgi:anti-sigma factor RsiW
VREIEELIGAYALDAVDPDEREQIEAHLATCPRCRDELAGHLEVAALLGNTGAPAPEGLWDRIASSLEEPPPALRLAVTPTAGDTAAAADVVELRPRRRWITRAVGAVAVAAAVVIGVLAVELQNQHRRIDEMQREIAASGMEEQMMEAMAAPSSHTMQLISPSDAAMSATAVMTDGGAGWFMTTSMPALEDDRTYQLWGVMADGQIVSLGVLGNAPHLAAFQASGGLTGLAVTEEVKGGVPSSSNPAVLSAEEA